MYGLCQYLVAFRGSAHIENPFFPVCLGSAIILAAVFLEEIWFEICRLKTDKSHPIKANGLIAIFICACLYIGFSDKQYYGNFTEWLAYQQYKRYSIPNLYDHGAPDTKLELERAQGIIVPFAQAQKMETITKYIKSQTRENEEIFVFPENSIYHFFADRPAIGRFNTPSLAWTSKEYQEELLNDLKRVKPRYVIYDNVLSVLAHSIGRKEEILPEITDYLCHNYKVEREYQRTFILKRN